MSKDNLLFFPKKSTPEIVMPANDAKWMLSGTIMVVLLLAIGANRALFSAEVGGAQASQSSGRVIASVRPVMQISWEDRTFALLNKDNRAPANVAAPASTFDKFAFGVLGGDYQVREVDGLVSQVQFAEGEGHKPKLLKDRQQFLSENLALFAKGATRAVRVHVQDNQQMLLEKYSLEDGQGKSLQTVEVLVDQNQNLLSVTVL